MIPLILSAILPFSERNHWYLVGAIVCFSLALYILYRFLLPKRAKGILNSIPHASKCFFNRRINHIPSTIPFQDKKSTHYDKDNEDV